MSISSFQNHSEVANSSCECFHCGLSADSGIHSEIDGIQRYFCCVGCRAVSELISNSGLSDFYRFREVTAAQPADFADDGYQSEKHELTIYDNPDYQSDFVTALNESTQNFGKVNKLANIQIFGMNCSACAWLIEKRLESFVEVQSAKVNFSQQRLFLEWDSSAAKLSDLLLHIKQLGFKFAPGTDDAAEAEFNRQNQSYLRRLGVAGIGMMQVGMYALSGYLGASDLTLQLLELASLIIATAVIFYSAQPFFRGAWRSIKNQLSPAGRNASGRFRKGMHLSMDVPVSVALALAYGASLLTVLTDVGAEVYFDAVCMFTFFLLISKYLELKARRRWSSQINRGDGTCVLVNDDGSQQTVPSKSLKPGDRILIKPGVMFPVDVRIDAGEETLCEVSEAQLTGEFSPVKRAMGEIVSAGSINLGAAIEVSVYRTKGQSTLASLKSMVDRAGMNKPVSAGMADNIASYFVTSVLVLAGLSYLFWSSFNPSNAFQIALSVLVVSCPCALSLATPTALTVLMNQLAKRGILVQNSEVLESLHQVDHIIFDKTGTLTLGEFCVEDINYLSGRGLSESIAIAQALEAGSSHPIAKGFENLPESWVTQGITDELSNDGQTKLPLPIKPRNWKAIDAKGIQAEIDGELYRIGEKSFVADMVEEELLIDSATQDSSQSGAKKIYLGSEREWLASFTLKDQPRPGLAGMMQQLRAVLPTAKYSIFSGDSSNQVDDIAQQLQIDDFRKSMTAEQKLDALQSIRDSGSTIMVVGDGLNDAPFLSAADISIAVSSAVDLSKQQSDLILLSKHLGILSSLYSLTQKGRSVIKQNICWALCYNLLALPFAILGLVPPWLAAIGMSLSSAVVVLNAFRAGRVQDVTAPAKSSSLPNSHELSETLAIGKHTGVVYE